jgi:hypothetical protein
LGVSQTGGQILDKGIAVGRFLQAIAFLFVQTAALELIARKLEAVAQ